MTRAISNHVAIIVSIRAAVIDLKVIFVDVGVVWAAHSCFCVVQNFAVVRFSSPTVVLLLSPTVGKVSLAELKSLSRRREIRSQSLLERG